MATQIPLLIATLRPNAQQEVIFSQNPGRPRIAARNDPKVRADSTS